MRQSYKIELAQKKSSKKQSTEQNEANTAHLSGLLVRRDLLLYEDILCADLAKCINFVGHALYFPTQDELGEIQYRQEEQKLLIPLRHGQNLLGILLLREASFEDEVLTLLPQLVKTCLDKIYYLKLSGLDELCALPRKANFMFRLQNDIQHITDYYQQALNLSGDSKNNIASDSINDSASDATNDSKDDSQEASKQADIQNFSKAQTFDELFLPFYADYMGVSNGSGEHLGKYHSISSVGLVVVSLLGLDYVRKIYGYAISAMLIKEFSKKLRQILPEDVLCTYLEDDQFAVLFQSASPDNMENLASQCAMVKAEIEAKALNSILAALDHVDNRPTVTACTGHALFPNDWDGTYDSRKIEEIPHILLQKAKIAAKRLKHIPQNTLKGAESKNGLQKNSPVAGKSLSFRNILLKSGNVISTLPYSQVLVNLGKEDGAQEGMCFSVWGDVAKNNFKGEIQLRKVGREFSEAEIRFLSDATKSPEEGDFLQFAPQSSPEIHNLDSQGSLLYAYSDFSQIVNDKIEQELKQNLSAHFCLSLLRIQWEKVEQSYFLENDNFELPQKHKFSMAEVAQEIHTFIAGQTEEIKNNPTQKDHTLDFEEPEQLFIMGCTSFNSLIIYHQNQDSSAVKGIYEKLSARLEEKFHIPIAVGIAPYPFLKMRPWQIWESSRKALDYALLLPQPQIGFFDSLALNISADKKLSQGDIFGAVEEYRLAILADKENILAWNSLGVCLAELERHHEAIHAFERAYDCNSEDPSTCYNLGNAHLSLKDKQRAKEFFLACLLQDPAHLFARIRLGETAESEGDFEEALYQYQEAKDHNSQSSVPYRYLAHLYAIQDQKDQARELIQTALQKNPDDAVGLQILAGLYLDAKEDAQLAELLARQSVALLPWRRASWAELARSLEAQGRVQEATEIRRSSIRL